jgi:hypothetical protein
LSPRRDRDAAALLCEQIKRVEDDLDLMDVMRDRDQRVEHDPVARRGIRISSNGRRAVAAGLQRTLEDGHGDDRRVASLVVQRANRFCERPPKRVGILWIIRRATVCLIGM